MAKPRIIIADTDESYIVPLQLKFVEDFFEKINLEIISDEDYFEELFSAPQSADILIVSEDLYSSRLSRHNIKYLFMMTEQQDDEMTTDLKVRKIHKYTSIKEIFNEIIGISGDVLRTNQVEKKAPQIVLVYSAAGGVGKTTLAMGIAACMTQNYKRVLYINASHLQTFQMYMENRTPISSSEIYAKLSEGKGNLYQEIRHVIRKEHFSYVPAFKAALMSLGLHESVFRLLAESARKSGEYDFIVVDADPSFDEEKAALISTADKVILVTEQTEASVFATNVLATNVNGMNSEKYIFVCNKFRSDADNALISPAMVPHFSVTEYVEYYEHRSKMTCADLAKEKGIQKVAFLVL